MNAERHPLELEADHVRRYTDPAALGFTSTAELSVPQSLVGQERAEESIAFALEIADERYNLYVAGNPGSGRLTSVLKAVREVAAQRPTAKDWCYVHHFERQGEPVALSLPAGAAPVFARDVDTFVIACRRELRRALGSDAYRKQRDLLIQDVARKRESLLDQLQQHALEQGFIIQATTMGLAVIPVRRVAEPPVSAAGAAEEAQSAQVQPIPPDEFSTLPPDEQRRIREAHDTIQQEIADVLPRVQELEEEARERIRAFNHDTSARAVERQASTLAQKYSANDRIVEFIRHVQADIVSHGDVLAALPGTHGTNPSGDATPEAEQEHYAEDETGDGTDDGLTTQAELVLDEDLRERPHIAALLRRYRVNVFVTHSPDGGAPIVQEINPTYMNLLGRIEYGLHEGLPYTDHLMMKAGSLHRGNGGFLILQARDILSHPHSWEAVKRVLRFGIISIEDGDEVQTTPASASLRPEPIPARIRVILVGDTNIYAALLALDPEFGELFKVRADFDTDMERTPETERFYGQLAASVTSTHANPPLSREAVALLAEEGSRWAEDQYRLSTRLRGVQDLVLEASHFAGQVGAKVTAAEHVIQAIRARERRASLISDKLDDLMRQGTILIDTGGEVVGQVNGLTVLEVAGYAFGKPARITARTSPGVAGIMNLERETLTSGPAHTKGILTLSGYLAGRYAKDYPLSLSASICFEQVYGEIEGDSASSAELYAILSSLANVGIRQSIAVTGSVNQHGVIQAVGGVTHKVEGFFKACKMRGLSGEQGVIIPKANVRNLMLREEVVDAIRQGLFHIYSVSTIDEGISILTGMPAGTPDSQGNFLTGTINDRVSRTLRTYAEYVRAYSTGLRMNNVHH